MAAHNEPVSLDVEDHQILIDFFDDPNFHWHHRVLLRRIKGSTWLVATPTLSVEILDVAEHRVLAVGRGTRFPARARGNCFVFDPFEEGELAALHAQADAVAEVLGAEAPAAGAAAIGKAVGHWRVSDPSHEDFGAEVGDLLMSTEQTGLFRDSVGICYFKEQWVSVERVSEDDLSRWKSEKREGPGRDPRLLPFVEDGGRYRSLEESVKTSAPVPLTDPWMEGWPHPGPRASVEVPSGVRAAGRQFHSYHELWEPASGVFPGSGICKEHKRWCTLLGLLQSFDGLDIPNTAGGEFACRVLLYLQAGVRANPKQPNFEGLDRMLEHTIDSSGGIRAGAFAEHIAKVTGQDAQTLKQHRLLREERAAKTKEKEKGKNKKKGDGKGDADT